MVQLSQRVEELKRLRFRVGRMGCATLGVAALLAVFVFSCTATVRPYEFGVEQHRFGSKTGVGDEVFGPGLYFIGPGTTMNIFPRGIHVLESTRKSRGPSGAGASREYIERRSRDLGSETYRVVDSLDIQTSDGYSVNADVTLLYSISDPVRIARDFGWGGLYVDAFVINTFRNGILATLGKLNAESFYDEQLRIAAVKEAEQFVRERFEARGFKVAKLLLRSYEYSPTYEKSLHDKKLAVQLAEKNRKESLVNDERAKLKQIESKGNATITIAESEVQSRIAKLRAEADLYSAQVHAKADQEVGLAQAEGKRLKADALNHPGARYVMALETAKMFDGVQSAVMTPEQYVQFVRNAWGLMGLSAGGGAP
jgi:regulator of protease activity HflC (stomatin/prohibitin superfamily)